jgi:hypothetical protein
MPVAGLPPEVADILTKVQIYSGAVVVSLAGCMAMAAGLMRTLGLREEGKKRYKDAVAGMTMVITAPAVIGIIATVLKAFFPATVALIHVGTTLTVMFL